MSPTPSETLRQTLTRALGAAQIAVKLDAADQDTMAIVSAYQRSISLLEDVIRRHPLEDEVKELSAIRSSYQERVKVLLLTRSVPIAQRSTETLVGTPEGHAKPWRLPGCTGKAAKARRWTMKRLKVLCGCTDGSVML
ncbi:hypothetical protein B0H13DRAFT_1981878 [Mycena leptocephala]|nr:hypothetical protein B0H13DRAFT_1981878 [Mycena leptocephala]